MIEAKYLCGWQCMKLIHLFIIYYTGYEQFYDRKIDSLLHFYAVKIL